MNSRISVVAIALLLLPWAAAAQSTPVPAPAGQGLLAQQAPGGPMTVERITSSFIVAPEVKVTRFDRRTSELVGGYAGRLTDRTFFIGGGGYWMANRSHDRQLAYGGLVVGLFARADRRVGFGVKGLVGGGRATVVRSISLFGDHDRDDMHILTGVVAPGRVVPGVVIPGVVLPQPIVPNVRVREEFFVVEPEANAVFKLSKRFRLTAGAGYRWAGARERGGRDGLSGASGSIGLQIST